METLLNCGVQIILITIWDLIYKGISSGVDPLKMFMAKGKVILDKGFV